MPAFSPIEIVIIFIGLLGTIFWIWALIDCARRRTDLGSEWFIWLVIIALTHALGALLYVLFYRVRVSSRR